MTNSKDVMSSKDMSDEQQGYDEEGHNERQR